MRWGSVIGVATVAGSVLVGFDSASIAQNGDTQKAVADLKQSMAANRSQLMKYQWLQTTEVAVKGETKKDQQMMCRFGPDGAVMKASAGPQ
jgi:hypothetical protein